MQQEGRLISIENLSQMRISFESYAIFYRKDLEVEIQ